MNFNIDASVTNQFPELRIGVLVAHGIKNKLEKEFLEAEKREEERLVRTQYDIENLLKHPFVLIWREVYRNIGFNPKKKTPTAEALLSRIIKGGNIPRISTLVDSYLIAEVKFLLPFGGYDLDKINGDIALRLSKGKESFRPLGGNIDEYTNTNEVIYSDDEKVLTRIWNYKDCEYSKITLESQNIILLTEAPSYTIGTEHILHSLTHLKHLIERFCGGEIRTFLVEVSKKSKYSLPGEMMSQ